MALGVVHVDAWPFVTTLAWWPFSAQHVGDTGSAEHHDDAVETPEAGGPRCDRQGHGGGDAELSHADRKAQRQADGSRPTHRRTDGGAEQATEDDQGHREQGCLGEARRQEERPGRPRAHEDDQEEREPGQVEAPAWVAGNG